MCWCVSVYSATVSTTGFTLHENVCQIVLQSQDVDAVYFPWNEAKNNVVCKDCHPHFTIANHKIFVQAQFHFLPEGHENVDGAN